jgi:translocator protein
MTGESISSWTPIVVAASFAVIVAISGGLATDTGPWYVALKKPRWQPPNWVFGPVWTTIFTLAAIAGVMAWRRAESGFDQSAILALFMVNAALNVLWSVLFFSMKRPDWALLEVAFLWLSILALMLFFWSFSPVSTILLLPYILWVSVASFLNWTILRLNGPFRV